VKTVLCFFLCCFMTFLNLPQRYLPVRSAHDCWLCAGFVADCYKLFIPHVACIGSVTHGLGVLLTPCVILCCRCGQRYAVHCLTCGLHCFLCPVSSRHFPQVAPTAPHILLPDSRDRALRTVGTVIYLPSPNGILYLLHCPVDNITSVFLLRTFRTTRRSFTAIPVVPLSFPICTYRDGCFPLTTSAAL